MFSWIAFKAVRATFAEHEKQKKEESNDENRGPMMCTTPDWKALRLLLSQWVWESVIIILMQEQTLHTEFWIPSDRPLLFPNQVSFKIIGTLLKNE